MSWGTMPFTLTLNCQDNSLQMGNFPCFHPPPCLKLSGALPYSPPYNPRSSLWLSALPPSKLCPTSCYIFFPKRMGEFLLARWAEMVQEELGLKTLPCQLQSGRSSLLLSLAQVVLCWPVFFFVWALLCRGFILIGFSPPLFQLILI